MEGDAPAEEMTFRQLYISIHALRVEGDKDGEGISRARNAISIHALRVEGDQFPVNTFLMKSIFQSTPSVWRATDLTS